MLSKLIFLATIILIIITLGWLIVTGKVSLVNTHEVNKNFSQFIELKESDEYVVAQLISNEEFSTEKYNYVMGLPVGDTSVKLSLVAHYKYYVKLAELTHYVKNGVIFVHVPTLYLSTPVAFEFSTVRESQQEFLFAPNSKALLEQLKQAISEQLISKGKSQMGVVYDKAAKALADNLNNYFDANDHGRNYKSIAVSFSSEGSQSQRQFNYNDSFCGKEPCSLELDLGKGRALIIK